MYIIKCCQTVRAINCLATWVDSPNFNYQPMLPDNSVPSTDDMETACTLVQIGDNVAPYMLDSDVPETPMFEGPEVSISDDAMDKIVGSLDMCMWKPSNLVDAMD